MKIGLTGTIASGKTTVSILLRRRGMAVFNCDNYAKTALYAGNECFAKIVAAFGEEIIGRDGDIDKKKMADLIFSDEEKRRQMNAIVHPYVLAGMRRFFHSHENDAIVFAEVPLLFEASWNDEFDRICVVTCSRETAVRRMMEDRGYTEEEAAARYESQIDPEKQKAMADHVIMNETTLKDLDHEINLWIRDLRKEAANGTEA